MKRSEDLQVRNIEAAVVRSPGGPLKIETLRMEGPQETEVLVRIVASGICHTDISMADFWETSDGPLVLGHEGAGVVESTGKKAKSVRPGDHVILSYQSCGTCLFCKSGRPARCRRFYELNFAFRRPDGSNALHQSGVRGHFFGQSSFASHVLATERNLVKVSRKLPLALLAPLGCGMQTGAGTILNMLRVRKGQSLVVLGTGSVGLAAIMAARLAGAFPAIGVDVRRSRLKLASELGASHVINSRNADVEPFLNATIPEGADYVLETTGNARMLQLAPQVTKKGGTAAFFTGDAIPDSVPRGVRAVEVIQGDSVPQVFIPQMIKLHQSGRFPFDRILTYYDFKDINRAIKDSRSGRTVKPVLLMNPSGSDRLHPR